MASLQRRQAHGFSGEEKLPIVEHFEFVQSRIEELMHHTKGLVTLLKKRIHVEKEHLKSMQKIAQSVHEDSQLRNVKFEGKLKEQWTKLCDGLLTEALSISNTVSTLETQSLQPVSVYILSDLDKRFKAAISDGRKAIREYQNCRTALHKAKDKYFSMAGEWESSLLALYNEEGDTWCPTPGNKLYEREQIVDRKTKELKKEYESAVEKLNSVQTELHTQTMPEVLLSLNTVALNMVSVLHKSLGNFKSCQQLLLGHEPTAGAQASLNNEEFNESEYTHQNLFEGKLLDSVAEPAVVECWEYPFKDQALIISTRKVQYQCMGQLTAAELVTRGQQFVSQMGQKLSTGHCGGRSGNSNGGAADNSPGVIIPALVTTCVQYLHQPLALKEEGIFRVPGDNLAIKNMHKEFKNPSANMEHLKKVVMDMKDPNTVSGLLKLHLRENHLLSEDTMARIMPILEARDHDRLERCLLALPLNELRPLTEVICLMATIVQDPWKELNKMTPRTLGIACSLSLFPNLDPGKSIKLLEMMIKHSEALGETQYEGGKK